VVNLQLHWPEAAVTAAALGVLAVGLRASRLPRATGAAVVSQEAALVFALYSLWQFAGSFAMLSPAGAVGRARWIWQFERAAGMPSEAAVQQPLLSHPLIIKTLNLYYAGLHFPVLIGCLIWLFLARRDRYASFRTTLAVFTACCLVIQLIPVAPPRLLPLAAMVDTAARYGQSVYSAGGGFDADQLSAMPSVHVGWAILVAIAVIAAARSRWRWLALLYPAMTTLTVVVTANHFWLDGIVAALLLGAVIAVQRGARRLAAGRVPRLAAAGRVPREAAGRVPRVAANPFDGPSSGTQPAQWPVVRVGDSRTERDRSDIPDLLLRRNAAVRAGEEAADVGGVG